MMEIYLRVLSQFEGKKDHMPLNITGENTTFLYFEAIMCNVWYSVADQKKKKIIVLPGFDTVFL